MQDIFLKPVRIPLAGSPLRSGQTTDIERRLFPAERCAILKPIKLLWEVMSMKRLIMFAINITVMFCLAGCGQINPASDNLTVISIADSVTEIELTHIVSGTETQWTVNSDELESLKNWMSGLNYSMVQFEDGNSPGDMDGGEVYRFKMTDIDHPGFSYVINGPDKCYLFMDGNWYQVSSPSDPPVTEPQREKLTIEKVKELAKKGMPCHGAILNHTAIQTLVQDYLSTSMK